MEWYQIKDLMGISAAILVVLIPVIGLTARFTIGPLIDRFARLRGAASEGTAQQLGQIARQISALEDRLDGFESDLHRIREAGEFERQLRSRAAKTES